MLKGFTLLIAIIFLILSKNKYRTWINPYTVFNILWIAVYTLICIGNEFVYEPSQVALSCMLVGILAFNISMFSKRLVLGKNQRRMKEYAIDIKSAYWISIITLAVSVILAAGAIQSFLSGNSLAIIRNDYYTYESSSSVWIYYLRNYIASPLRYITIIVAALDFLGVNGTKNKKLLINMLLIVVLQAITSGGRYVLMNTMFVFICVYLFYGAYKNYRWRHKLIIIGMIALLGYAIVYLTNDRTTHLMQSMNTVQKLYTTIYEYFAGSVTYMGKVIETSPEIIGKTFGLNMIAGFLIPLFVAFNFLHILPYPQVFNYIGTYACAVLQIGPNTYYNAMPTIFGYFYIDGGLFLTFIEAWIFGYVCKRVFEKALDGSLLNVAFYLLIFIQICNSSTRWFFFSPDFCLAFIFLRFVFRPTGKILSKE